MYKELFLQMTELVESSKKLGLFSSFHDDFYVCDRDQVENDFQVTDRYFWQIKECGTYLARIRPDSELLAAYLSSLNEKHRYFIIEVNSDGCVIKEFKAGEIKGAVAKTSWNANRTPRREYARHLLLKRWPALEGSLMLSRMAFTKGEEVYLSVTNNSLSYAISTSCRADVMSIPFSTERETGYFKLCVTTDFGHGELVAVTSRQYNAAQKRLGKARVAA